MRTLFYAGSLTVAAVLLASDAKAPDSDIAIRPVVPTTNPGPEYSTARRLFQGIPGIERMANGRLWATWYSGGKGEGPFNYVLLVSSGDDGKTWSEPRLVVDPPDPVRAYDPCLWKDPRGRLWWFWAQSAGHWDGRGGVWAMVSEDADREQPHWSQPRRIANGVMMNKPTVLASGDWLLPIAGWRFKTPNVASTLARNGFTWGDDVSSRFLHGIGEGDGSAVYASADEGRSFQLRGQARVPETQYDEHSVVERRNGDLWMLVRTTSGIGQSVSHDGGRTWSGGGSAGIGQPVTRFFVRRLKSGKLLLVRNNPPDGKTRSHLTAYLSGDDGVTWMGGLMLDEREQTAYPDGTQAPNGDVYVIYDRERTAAREILMAQFAEEDVMAGHAVNPRTRLRVIVNRAGETN